MITTSIVVVAYEMARELPRTLRTLADQIDPATTEILVVDNGSPSPIVVEADTGARVIRIDDAPPSPARAANTGIAAATGDLIGVIIDGARMASPGLIAMARRAAALGDRTVVTAPAYHLGSDVQMASAADGYDQDAEDQLLDSIDWRGDGSLLFGISVLAASSSRGWFGPMGESSSLFLTRTLWDEHGGYDEAFDRPGGGLVNHDAYRRACELPGITHVTLLGEGTFHQYHGGAATGGPSRHDELWAEYEAIRGVPFTPPRPATTYLGTVPDAARPHLERSVQVGGAAPEGERTNAALEAQITALQRERGRTMATLAEKERILAEATANETPLAYLMRRARNIPASIRRRRRQAATKRRIAAERPETSAADIERRRATIAAFLAETQGAMSTESRTPTDGAQLTLPTSTTPVVSVIIPTHNAIDELLDCLRSFVEHPPITPYEVIIANDVSDEGAFAPIREIGGLRIVDNERNLGFLMNCNEAARYATGRYLWFLNSDTELTTDALDALAQTFADFDGAAIAGSKLLFGDGGLQEGGGIVWRDGSAWNYGRSRPARDQRADYAREPDYVSGAALMVDRAFFDEVGGFDTAFAPAYYEDTDLCMQARAAGRRVVYQPASVVIHHEGASHGTDADDTSSMKHHQVVNQETFERKWREVLATHNENCVDPEREKERHVGRRVLIIDARMVTPDEDAGSLRMVNLMQAAVALGDKVTFLPQNLQADEPMASTLRRAGVEVVGRPDVRFVEDFLRERGQEFDVIMLSRLEVAADLLGLAREAGPDAHVIFDTVDLHFLREYRETAADLGRTDPDATAALELSCIERADLTLVVSTAEQELLRRLVPDAAVSVISNMHDVDLTESPAPARDGLLFVGGFEHQPNADGIRWFVSEIFPEILASRPETELHIVGSKMPESLRELGGEQVHVHGFVPDLRDLYESSRAAIAPLRFGAGVKGKVTSALAVGLPCVATSIATEGTAFTDERDLLVADDAAGFAAACLRLLDDDALWTHLRSHGAEAVEREFGTERARIELDRAFSG
ncbi:MAG: glycosyltransferase [Actinomycetota bacterium]